MGRRDGKGGNKKKKGEIKDKKMRKIRLEESEKKIRKIEINDEKK